MDASVESESNGRRRSFPASARGEGDRLATAAGGAVSIDLRSGEAAPRPILVRSNRPMLVVMQGGEAVLGCGSFRAELSGKLGALLARSAVATLEMAPDAQALLIGFERTAFQAAASRLLGVPHRLIASNAELELPRIGPLMRAARARHCDEMAIYAALVDALGRASGEARRLEPVEGLIRAAAYIAAHPETAASGEDIAAVAGLGVRSLRRAYRDVLGIRLGEHLQQARLQRIRERLRGGFESRTIREIALAAGFGSAAAFARVYARSFGETPSQTRAEKARERTVM